MRISILGRGPLAAPLARLAERAGHTVRWAAADAAPSRADDAADLAILAGSRAAVESMLARIPLSISQDIVVVDATIPTENDSHGDGAEATGSDADWIKTALPLARIVRAFASVPAEALAAVLDRPTSGQPASLAVPLAGDDRQAKALVGTFMREIGVEPFDLGALGSADVLDPGGALWGKALSPVEMLEAVGWLSGDG